MSTQSTDQAKAYITKEVSQILDIGTSTLRKWCLALEKNNYDFMRTEQNRRLFVENDIIALKHLQSLIQQNNMSLENASMIVASKYEREHSSTGTPSVLQENERSSERSDEAINKLMDHIEKQERFNKELVERLEAQQRYIDERIGERDKKLMETLNQIQEKKQEEIKLLEAATQEKKGFLARLFGK